MIWKGKQLVQKSDDFSHRKRLAENIAPQNDKYAFPFK